VRPTADGGQVGSGEGERRLAPTCIAGPSNLRLRCRAGGGGGAYWSFLDGGVYGPLARRKGSKGKSESAPSRKGTDYADSRAPGRKTGGHSKVKEAPSPSPSPDKKYSPRLQRTSPLLTEEERERE